MIKHLAEPATLDYTLGLTACGLLITRLSYSSTTSAHKKVTCQECKDILKERKSK